MFISSLNLSSGRPQGGSRRCFPRNGAQALLRKYGHEET